MERMKLAELTTLLGVEELPEADLRAVVTDSRKITKDCLFVALSGENFDGNDYVEEALEKGAAAAISTRAFPELPVITVSDTLEALGEIATYYKNKFKVKTVAVTGSVGKTTTKEFIYSALKEKYKTLKTDGNFNNEIGLPLTIFNLSEEIEVLVVELGMNHKGEMERLSRIARPDIAVITNIGTAHIENLGSREGILAAKLEILEGTDPEGLLLYNGDEPLLREAAKILSIKSESFGMDASNDYYADGIFELDGETDFVLHHEEEEYAVNIAALGQHNVQNALCAAAVATALELSTLQIQHGLSCFEQAAGRQNIYELSGIRLIDDTYNANPDSMKAALSVLKSFEGRRIAVLGDMLELGDTAKEAHLEIGEVAAKCADIVLAAGQFSSEVKSGAEEGGLNNSHAFLNQEDLITKLCAEIQTGDTILFKGSRSTHMEEVLKAVVKEVSGETSLT